MSGRDGGTGETAARILADANLRRAAGEAEERRRVAATSDADPASTSASEVEGLAEAMCEHPDDVGCWCGRRARAILASVWLRDREAAAANRGRAEGLREAAAQGETLRLLVRASALVVMAEVDETDKALATAVGSQAGQAMSRWLRARADSLAAPRGDGEGA